MSCTLTLLLAAPPPLRCSIRPIYADWSIYPERYNETLAWFNATYGWPGKWVAAD